MFNYRVKETSSWLTNLINSHESGTIIGLPMSGKLRTVETVVDNLNLSDSMLVVDLSILPTRLINLSRVLRPKLDKFVREGGQILYLENCGISSKLSRRQLKVVNAIRTELGKKYICIYSFNEDITLLAKTISQYSYLSPINQNILYFPYASPSETQELMAQNEMRFNTKLSPAEASKVFSETSGVPYLIKSYFKEKQVSSEAITNLLSSFTSKQINDLKNLSNSVIGSYQKLGLVDSAGKIVSHKISSAVQAQRLSTDLNIDPEKTSLFVGKQKISDELMSYEKEILIKMHSNSRLSRDEIATICYGPKKSSEYSDYAIDKIISRLRSNLKRIGVDPKIVKTNRGFGYSLHAHVQ